MKIKLLPQFILFGLLLCGAFVVVERRDHGFFKTLLAKVSDHPESPLDGIREFAEYEFNLLKNPQTGNIPKGTFAEEWAQALATEKVNEKQSSSPYAKTSSFGTWQFKGPSNLGGRTRAIGIDVNNNNIILAGGVSGGICRSTDGGSSWTTVTANGSIRNITSIAQDTRSGQTSTWYFCTGEGIGNSLAINSGVNGNGSASAFYLGNGVYKSTNNGVSWTRLTNSNPGSDETFDQARDLCWRVAVNPVNGDVYLAALNSIYRSTNGGSTWSSVLAGAAGSSGQTTDIVINSVGTMYAAFSGAAGSAQDGVWTSTNGTSWTRIAGNASPTNWNASGAYGRVVLALAPSQQTTLFALYYNNYNSNCGSPAPEAELFKYDSTSSTWTDLSSNLPDESGCQSGNDPFACQQGYDLCIAVKPNDPSTVFIGGTNVYRSTSGFTNTSATTRIGGYVSSSSYGLYANHHADVHELVFASGSNNVLYTGTDGGIHKSDITASTPAWTSLNNSYPSYQYYHVALDPATGSSLVLGGAQDNGTTYMNHGSTTGTSYFSGDGCSVGMSSGGGVFYFSTQYGTTYRDNAGAVSIAPATGKSMFVTNFLLDPDNTSYMYYANGNDLYRTASASTVTTSTGWTLFSGLATAIGSSKKIYGMAASRGTYSTNTGTPATLSRLYVGTDNGQLYRIDDPQNFTAANTPSDITPTSMTANGTIVSIAVDPSDSRKVMAVYSNYGVNSVWYTADASAASPTWTNVEGNISALSFRSVVILHNGTLTEYVVGTSKGIYSVSTLNGSSTNWRQEAPTSIGYVPVLDIEYRRGDQTLLAGTHGNGMFISTNFPLPVNFISFDAYAVSSSRVNLNWTAAGGEKVSKYIVQRSADGKLWENAGTVISNGSSANSSYSSSDYPTGRPSKLYYRIRAEEVNGDANYSAIVPVSFSTNGTTIAGSGIYPTLVSSYLSIEAEQAGSVAVLNDLQGRKIASVPLGAGKNNHDLSMLPAGQYIVTVYAGGQAIRSARIVKQ